jgi:hypothetical protein
MTRLVLIALSMLVFCTTANAQVWATATSTHPTNGRMIVFRFIKEFSPGFNRTSQPDRVIIVWKYQSDNGMPTSAERQRMDAMEDSVQPVVEQDNFATLSLVSTGENLREWTYYVKSRSEFMARFNKALTGLPTLPIEVHAATDPNWTMYDTFRAGLAK